MQLLGIRQEKYLNVGCGSNIQAGFVNIDYGWRPGVNLCWDITRGLPFSEPTFRGLYTEHCLEHLSYHQAVDFLKDAFRLIAPRGAIRIVVPDGGLYLDLYARAKSGAAVTFPYVGKEGADDLQADSTYGFTPMMAVNRIFRGYGHLFAYDAETLSKMLQYCGFEDVRQADFRSGRDPALLIDSELRRPQSLYIEASR